MGATRFRSQWPVLHGGVFLAAWLFTALCCGALPWPWHFLLPVTAYACVCLLVAPLRRTVVWPGVGRINALRVIVATTLTLSTIVVLVGYQSHFQPVVTALGAAIPVAAFGNIVWAGVCFSILNAALEELAFRGVLFDAMAAEWGNACAVGATSVCFGFAHLHGYPPGPLGAMLAGLFGVALGLLRWWTGGLGLPFVCHVGADATIFSILAAEGALPELP